MVPTQIGRFIISLIDSGVRLAALAAIWLAFVFLYGSGADGIYSFFVLVLGFPVGLLLSHFIMNRKLLVQELPGQIKTQSALVVPPEALRLRDMISLLDEDDLDDLRAEVRETLRERIHRLSADESETFEELLSDSKRKRR